MWCACVCTCLCDDVPMREGWTGFWVLTWSSSRTLSTIRSPSCSLPVSRPCSSTARKGTVLVTNAVETQGKGRVLRHPGLKLNIPP